MIIGLLYQAQPSKSLSYCSQISGVRSTQKHRLISLSPNRRRNNNTIFSHSLERERKKTVASSTVIIDRMTEAQPDMLFAAAMPKEEIGALAFLKVGVAHTSLFCHQS